MSNKRKSKLYNIIGAASSVILTLICLQRYINMPMLFANMLLIVGIGGNLIVLNNIDKLYFKCDDTQRKDFVRNIKIIFSSMITISVMIRLIDLMK